MSKSENCIWWWAANLKSLKKKKTLQMRANHNLSRIKINVKIHVNSVKTCRLYFLMLFPQHFSLMRNIHLHDDPFITTKQTILNAQWISVCLYSLQTFKHSKTKRECVCCLFLFWICRITSMADWFLQFKAWILSWTGRKTHNHILHRLLLSIPFNTEPCARREGNERDKNKKNWRKEKNTSSCSEKNIKRTKIKDFSCAKSEPYLFMLSLTLDRFTQVLWKLWRLILEKLRFTVNVTFDDTEVQVKKFPW